MPLLFESRRMSTMPKKIDPELRARAVRLVRDHQQEYASPTEAMAAVAKQLGVARESVRRWVAQAEVDAGTRPGVTTEENEEIRRLKAENRRLREDVAVLKAATTFFAGELDPRNRLSWRSSTRCAPRAMRSSRSAESCASRAARSPHGPTGPGSGPTGPWPPARSATPRSSTSCARPPGRVTTTAAAG